MNKKLIALAVAAASVAPAAMAQTANPVTLYGRIYVMFESVEAKGGASPVQRRNPARDRVQAGPERHHLRRAQQRCRPPGRLGQHPARPLGHPVQDRDHRGRSVR